MAVINDLRVSLANIINPIKNSYNDARQFVRYGNGLRPRWQNVEIKDEDLYTGYFYAAIKTRANSVARVAIDNVKTESNIEGLIHPHLETITRSNTFSDYAFWHDISTYLDLEGVYYLLAVRNVDGDRVGDVQEFKMLNPYNIRRVMSADKLEVVGYVEARKGFVREIPKEMIIEIREMNPFDEDKPLAMTDAAKDTQFTLKTADDYTRQSLQHNINAPGIITTDVILPEKDFINFVDRVKGRSSGEPIFGNGEGAITYQSMQNELSKAALKDVNEINRDLLFSVAGVSKTLLGIEQSGTTRETSRVQRELSIENHILPRIQLIIDALNIDYKLYYQDDYSRNKAGLVVDNPLAVDHDADLKDTEVLAKRFDLYKSMVDGGVDPEQAGLYVTGDLEIVDVEIKELEPVVTQTVVEPVEQQNNSIELTSKMLAQQQEARLMNAITNIDARLVASAVKNIKRVVKNDLTQEEELLVVPKSVKNDALIELNAVLASFFGVAMYIFGNDVIKSRVKDFGGVGQFSIDGVANKYIQEISSKTSESHVETVLSDIFKSIQEASLEGLSITEIENRVKTKFTEEISNARAKTIARTESNRAFTRAQYEADRQFIGQNGLKGRVYKQWVTRSDNPCAFCKQLESEGLVLFEKDFRGVGDKIKTTIDGEIKEYAVTYEDLEAGNAHPNCSCTYELIIRDAA